MNSKYDVIIIGSGIGGLAAASLLSAKKRVLVLEQNGMFGGYCSSFSRKDYRFETAVQSVNGLYRGSPVYDILKRSKGLDSIKIMSPQHLYRSVFPEYDIQVPQANIKKYVDMLGNIFPREKDNIKALFGTLKSIYLEMERFYTGSRKKKSPFILKYCRRSLQELMSEFTGNKELQAIISQYWMYRGLPPSRFSAITFAYIWYDYTVNGSYFPERGMESIIKNLIRNIKRNKGDVLPCSEAVKIVSDRDIVKEIVLKNGKRYSSDIFISNIDLFKTFGIMEGADSGVIDPFVDKLRGDSLSISAFKIYLGLNIDLKRAGLSEYEIFVNPSYDAEAMYQMSVNNKFEKVPYSITAYSNLSGAFCSKGRSVVTITSLSGYGYWRVLTRSEYREKKAAAADILLSRCEKIIPGIRKHIDEMVVGTPLTMERYTGNSEGAIYGWNKRSLVNEIRFINPTTPVKNLFLSSHWTKMGGGVGGVLLASDRVSSIIEDKG